MLRSEGRRPPALLLTAGLGTRLQPLTYQRAKAAIPINGEALVHRVMRWLLSQGFDDFVLNLHHRPASISAVVGDGADLGVRVRYSWEQPVLGSAGGPRHALPLVTESGGHFLIVNGDTLTDVDLDALLEAHRRSGALVTMALIRNPHPDKYGGVIVSDEGWVTKFTPRQAGPSLPDDRHHPYHFIGVQVADAAVFAGLQDGVPAESVNSLYPRLMATNPRAVAAFISGASFLDIGTPRDCFETAMALAATEPARPIGARARIAKSAVLTRTTLWDDVTVGAEAQLFECIVGDGVTIPAGARHDRSAIVPAGGRAPSTGERVEGELLIRPF